MSVQVFIFFKFCTFFSIYSWYGRKGKISAPQYIDLVMTHIQKHVEDESCLPSKYGRKYEVKLYYFPKTSV